MVGRNLKNKYIWGMLESSTLNFISGMNSLIGTAV